MQLPPFRNSNPSSSSFVSVFPLPEIILLYVAGYPSKWADGNSLTTPKKFEYVGGYFNIGI